VPCSGPALTAPGHAHHNQSYPLLLVLCRLSADEALAAGLVSRVVPPEQLMPEAMIIADKLAT
jgi:enoyl-CoA hydratase/carnithine racemase